MHWIDYASYGVYLYLSCFTSQLMPEFSTSTHGSRRLFYIYDPMCSWCYAFAKGWYALQQALSADIQIIYVVGGLAPDTVEPMPETMRTMIQHTWRKIEKMVPGVQFNYDFWACNTPIRSTYPACRAMLAAKKQEGVAGLVDMLCAIQTAYYQQAQNPSLPETLTACAGEIGLDITLFATDLVSDNINIALKQEIQLARKLDAFSFPALRFMQDEKLYSINVEYLDHQKMLNEINTLIA
ncbi:MAG TPA: DsbA family protein [Nitrosomonas sp.]|nr:DsbA family protein [Nitrosomonas sp.]